MPFKAPPFDVYRSLLRLVSPFPAFRTKWNCPGGEFLSTYLPAIFLLPEWMSTPAQPRAHGLAQDRGHFPHTGWHPLPLHGHAADATTTFRRNSSEELRVGKACVSAGGSGCEPD